MWRARKRNTYSTFVVSELEGCMSKGKKIMKISVVSEAPKTSIFPNVSYDLLIFALNKILDLEGRGS